MASLSPPGAAQDCLRAAQSGPVGVKEDGTPKRRCYRTRFHDMTKGLFGSTKAVSTSPVANLLLVHLLT